MGILIPKIVYHDVFQITPECLTKWDIKAMFFDLDGTLASRHARRPDDRVDAYLKQFLKAGIKIVILSNNSEERVSEFCEGLDVLHVSRARKPLSSGFFAAQKLVTVPLEQTAIIGDQIFTDVFGGNRLKALTIYVESIDKNDFIIKLRFQFERWFVRLGIKSMRKRESNL